MKRLLLASTLLLGCTPTDEGPMQSDPGDDDAGVDLPACAPSSELPELRINEFMAKNGLTILDDEGIAHDWVEIHNMSSTDASMCGWTLRTVGKTNESYEFAELVVPAGGHTLIWLTGDRAITRVNQAALKIYADGGEVALYSPDGTEVDRVTFAQQVADFSASRLSDGDELWGLAWHPTPGEANADLGLEGEFQGTTPNQVPSAEGLTELVLGYDEVPQIEIRIDALGIDSLRSDPRLYVPGYLTFKGREYGPVGIHLKGSNSFQPIDDKPSFRINIDEYVAPAKFFGLDDLTLNNMDNDFSMMHERLSYLLARQTGPASRSNHTLVTLNGIPYGLYANVETVKRHMVEGWFADATGSLFEATDVDFKPEFIDLYEHETGPDERTLLSQLATALQNPNADQAIAAASQYVDMDAFVRFWANCAVVGQFDSFPYSDPGDDYFVYADPTSNKLHFMPWGMDETFYAGSFDVLQVKSVLATKCLASPSCKQKVVNQIWDTLDIVESFDWEAERARIVQQISPYMMADDNKPYTNAEVTEYHNQLRYFISGRRANLTTMLPPRSP